MTPSKARLLTTMRRYTELDLDDAVFELAEQDTIPESKFVELGMIEERDKRALQYIIDMNYRVSIPAHTHNYSNAIRVINAAMKLYDDPTNVAFFHRKRFEKSLASLDDKKGTHLIDLNPTNYIDQRRKLLVIDFESANNEHTNVEMIGKVFPKIICFGSMSFQLALAFGNSRSTATEMGKFLYPAAAKSISLSNWKQSEQRTLIAMGVCPEYVENIGSSKRKLVSDDDNGLSILSV
jgi:hypothetical protein